MKTRRLALAAVPLLTGAGFATIALAPNGGEGADVRAYILAHPEIIPEAIDRLRAKEAGKAVQANRAAIETPFAGAWAGAAEPTATLVVFYDYACGFCRQSLPAIERLLRADAGLRVVFRDLPVLGPDSEAAARVSLAAASQGKFKRFHDTLWAGGRPTAANVARAAAAAGVETAPPPNAKREIEINLALASALGFNGTPSWVIGDQVLTGAVGYERLKSAIAAARAS